MPKSFGQIIVNTPRGSVNLTFANRKVFDETLHKLRREGFDVKSEFWGYTLHTSPDEALTSVRMFGA